jgi:hypothetical protein
MQELNIQELDFVSGAGTAENVAHIIGNIVGVAIVVALVL